MLYITFLYFKIPKITRKKLKVTIWKALEEVQQKFNFFIFKISYFYEKHNVKSLLGKLKEKEGM